MKHNLIVPSVTHYLLSHQDSAKMFRFGNLLSIVPIVTHYLLSHQDSVKMIRFGNLLSKDLKGVYQNKPI